MKLKLRSVARSCLPGNWYPTGCEEGGGGAEEGAALHAANHLVLQINPLV